ncbi:uncharacterized protein LOC116303245 isoform X2 [Actinia tenebrosa]|uniref:Uncharacterized protein LOC116303245 isoform X2 n=1 Tax=Actinia tenebrosa TaxID=6105 RepID=A0A6P8IQS0_ACTTE|nr:uncharacterized protein LOC116303245 isoform X2 [Actinia tenebrosa]
MVLFCVYLVAIVLRYFAVCILADSTSNITTTVLHSTSYVFTHTHTQTPTLSILPTPLGVISSSSTSSHAPRLTATPASSKDTISLSSMYSSVISNDTNVKRKPPRIPGGGAELSSFGIVMVVIAGILVAVMIVCLLIICCRGRERGPERAHTPHHSNVKMKPWKTADLSTTNELSEDSIYNTNHPKSHHNSGLVNTSPQLSPTSNNNSSLNTTTESFRESQLI